MEYKLFIVDDDDNMRAALARLARQAGYRSEDYASAEAFLEAYIPYEPGVLILDLRMPGIGGLELLRILAGREVRPPVIVISGAADVTSAVQAMKLGALDVLEKPFDESALLERVGLAAARDARARELAQRRCRAEARLGGLTAMERKVLDLLCDGDSTKAIAARLGLSVRTVETHRLNIKRKTHARSLPEMIGLGMLARAGSAEGEAQ